MQRYRVRDKLGGPTGGGHVLYLLGERINVMKSTKQVSCIVAVAGMSVFLVGGCASPVDQAAKEAFLGAIGNTTITVFPAFVRYSDESAYEADAANRTGEFLPMTVWRK